MRFHILKVKDIYFNDILIGFKTFELRKNDRDYHVNDLIHFVDIRNREFDKDMYNVFQITYVLKDVPEYGLHKDYCVLGIKKLR